MSKIEVNTVAPQCGTTLTLGESGDTVTLGSGASQSGFGRTGTVDWQTTPKTGDFTAANGEGYFVNTTSGTITMTMPSGSAGAIVSIQDYNKTFDQNAFTVSPASGQKINGGTADGPLLVSTEGQGLTFVYVDSTVGWKTVHENEFTGQGSINIIATGGTITCCGDFRIHTFTGPGTFEVSGIAGTPACNAMALMVVAGGGGGGGSVPGFYSGGGGGAGGYREFQTSPVTPYTASPLVNTTGITATVGSFPIVVGGGGTGGCGSTGTNPGRTAGTAGSNSSALSQTSAGGGLGGKSGQPGTQNGSKGGDGGSGGGSGGYANPSNAPAGSGNTPPVSPPQGQNGGSGDTPSSGRAGGGGGAGGAGVGAPHPAYGAAGGAGTASSITGSPVTRAAGGKAGSQPGTNSPAGTNTGNGGSGQENCSSNGVNGASGIVIIRYKAQ